MEIKLDQHGYLADFNLWNEDIARYFAAQDKLELTIKHWEIIYLMRKFYQQQQQSPGMRILVKTLRQKYGNEKNSIYLYRLFPKGPAQQATRIAGLPKPIRCI